MHQEDLSELDHAIVDSPAPAPTATITRQSLQEAYQAEQGARQAAEHAADRLHRLQTVSAALSGAVTVFQVAEVIVEQGITSLGGCSGVVALKTDEGTALDVLRATGYPREAVLKWRRIPIDSSSMLADTVRTGEPIWLGSYEEMQARYPRFASVNQLARAFAALPLRVEGRIIGSLGFSFTRPGEASEDDKAFMQTLAQQCAQALERARLYDAAQMEIAERKRAESALRESEEEERRFQEQLTVLHELSNTLSRAVSRDDLCRQAVALGRERLGFERLGLWFLTPDSGAMVGSYGIDERGEIRDERRCRVAILPDSTLAKLLTEKTPTVYLADIPLLNERSEVVGRGEQAVAALWDGEEVIGSLSADNLFSHQPISERQQKLLRLYASTLGHLCSRLRTEEALRESETMYRSLADSMPQIVWTARADGSVDYYNLRWTNYTGLSLEQSLGQGWEAVLHPDDLPVCLDRWDLAVQTGRRYEIEYRFKRVSDGTYRWFLGRAVPVKDKQGVILRWFGTCTDIDDQKRAEAEIAALNERLHRSIYESSHRIKNQLQILASVVDLQLMEGREMIPAGEFRRLATQIRTVSAVQELLTADAKTDGTASQVSIKALLDKVLWMLQQTAGRHRIHYHIEEASVPAKVGTALALVANELVSNAIKHGNAKTDVTFLLVENVGRLEVCDDGPGFPNSFEPKLAANTGLELIDGLTRTDLAGQVRYENHTQGGAKVTVTFTLRA